jgi:hypothetical protein
MDDRARLTLPDIAFIVFSMAALGALYPVFSDAFAENVGHLTTGTALIFQLVLPLAILVFLYVIYRKAIRGAQL